MTGPGQPAPPPGWYPDPDGAPGLVRWWNGADLVRRRDAGRSRASPSSRPRCWPPPRPAALAGAAGRDPSSGERAPDRLGRRRLAARARRWSSSPRCFLGPVRRRRDPVADADVVARRRRAAGRADVPARARCGSSTRRPASPIRYLGDGWFEFDLGPQDEITAIAGQYFTTQEVTPDGGDLHRPVHLRAAGRGLRLGRAVARLRGDHRRRSPTACAATTTREPNERRVLRDEARTVDGHAAHLYEFQLSWDVARLRRDRRAGRAAAHRRRPPGAGAALHLDPEHPRRALRRHRPGARGRRRAVTAVMIRSPDHPGSWLTVDGEPGPAR